MLQYLLRIEAQRELPEAEAQAISEALWRNESRLTRELAEFIRQRLPQVPGLGIQVLACDSLAPLDSLVLASSVVPGSLR